jgi:predicted transcriptional regulator
MNEITQKLDAQNIRDAKIWNLTLLGWSKSRIADELQISRTTVSIVVNSEYGQKRLAEMYENIEEPLLMLPELVGLSLNQLRHVLEGTCGAEKSKSIVDAAKLVLGVAAKFKELDRNVVRAVTHINDIKADSLAV